MKRIAAKRMWACRLLGETTIHSTVEEANRHLHNGHLHNIPAHLRKKGDRIYPLATIDVSDEAALVEVATEVLAKMDAWHFPDYTAEQKARAVLEAIGVVRKGPK